MQRLLIIEDDRNIAEGIQDILGAAGYDSRIAEDGMTAVALLKEEKIDLILMDVHLRAESGYDLCREIRKNMEIPGYLSDCVQQRNGIDTRLSGRRG